MSRLGVVILKAVLKFCCHHRLFKRLKQRYNGVQLALLNKLPRSRVLLTNVTFNIKILENCLGNAVAPKSIERRIKKAKLYHSANIERSFGKDELERSRIRLERAKTTFYRQYQEARSFLSASDFIHLSLFLSDCDCKQRSGLEKKNDDMIRRLRHERFGDSNRSYESIINLAGIELTVLEKEVLCRGVDFGVPPRRITKPEILAEFELLHRQINELQPVTRS